MKTEMICPNCYIKMRRTGRIKLFMTDEGPAPYRKYECPECGYEVYNGVYYEVYDGEGENMFCACCSKPIKGTPEIREIRDCFTGRFFEPLHKECVRRFERLNRTWKLEKFLSQMIAYLFVHLVPTYAGGYTDHRILWVI